MLFRWGIFLLACVFLYSRLDGSKGTQLVLGPARLGLIVDHAPVLLLILVLMVVNWSIEALKWRMLMAPLERIGPARALLATVAGTSVGLLTINRTGEFLGRVLFLRPENRIGGGFATALGSIAQFVVTLMFGGTGLLALLLLDLPMPWPAGWISWMLVSLTSMATVLSLLLYFNPTQFGQLVLLLPLLRRLGQATSVLGRYSAQELRTVFFLSALRYGVFGFQFLVILHVANAGLPAASALVAVPLVYLIATLIPSVMLTELGVRGSVAVAVMGPLGASEPLVLLATATLWTINVALPALIGSVILLFARIRTRNTHE